MLSVRDQIRRRRPIERPLDVIGLELLVTVTQALLAGILLSLAAQLGGDARAYGLPIPGLLSVLAITVGVGWLRWLVGGSGWVMASVGLATGILTGALWLLSLQDASLPRVDWLVGLLAALCAIYGLIAGVFLDGPHRAHWKGGVSQPRRGVPENRANPARFSPPVQRVVDERLTNVRLPQVALPSAARLKAVSIPRPGRATATPETEDGLSVAAEVAPSAAPGTEPGMSPEVDAQAQPASPEAIIEETPAEVAAAPAPVGPHVEPATELDAPHAPDAVSTTTAASTEATEVVEVQEVVADEPTTAEPVPAEVTTATDPDAPTQPIASPAAEWPRPIEPRPRTGAHTIDRDT